MQRIPTSEKWQCGFGSILARQPQGYLLNGDKLSFEKPQHVHCKGPKWPKGRLVLLKVGVSGGGGVILFSCFRWSPSKSLKRLVLLKVERGGQFSPRVRLKAVIEQGARFSH